MAEYIDREAVVKRIIDHMETDILLHGEESDWLKGMAGAMGIVDQFPQTDAVEVVRCPDCFYHYDDGYHMCRKLKMECPDDVEFFCKYGKRREDR